MVMDSPQMFMNFDAADDTIVLNKFQSLAKRESDGLLGIGPEATIAAM